jgi:hypothetical protein
MFKAGPLFGFQQRLFRHGYIDMNASLNYQNRSVTTNNKLGTKANIAIGFAL